MSLTTVPGQAGHGRTLRTSRGRSVRAPTVTTVVPATCAMRAVAPSSTRNAIVSVSAPKRVSIDAELGDRQQRTADDDDDARRRQALGARRARSRARMGTRARAGSMRRRVVEQRGRGRGAQRELLGHDGDLRAVADHLDAEGGEHRDAELELVVGGVVRRARSTAARMSCERRVSSNWRTMSWPVRADVRQCTLRSASPGSYGAQRVERDVVVGDGLRDLALEVAHEAGRRRPQPRGDADARRARRGRSSARSRRSRPSWSPRTETAGPATMTARRLVGTAKSSSCSPSGCERRDDELGEPGADGQLQARRASTARSPVFATTSRPSARSPATTRAGCSSMSTR